MQGGHLPQPAGLSTTYFVRLLLKDASGNVVDRNVYWLSTKADTLNYDGRRLVLHAAVRLRGPEGLELA